MGFYSEHSKMGVFFQHVCISKRSAVSIIKTYLWWKFNLVKTSESKNISSTLLPQYSCYKYYIFISSLHTGTKVHVLHQEMFLKIWYSKCNKKYSLTQVIFVFI